MDQRLLLNVANFLKADCIVVVVADQISNPGLEPIEEHGHVLLPVQYRYAQKRSAGII